MTSTNKPIDCWDFYVDSDEDISYYNPNKNKKENFSSSESDIYTPIKIHNSGVQ